MKREEISNYSDRMCKYFLAKVKRMKRCRVMQISKLFFSNSNSNSNNNSNCNTIIIYKWCNSSNNQVEYRIMINNNYYNNNKCKTLTIIIFNNNSSNNSISNNNHRLFINSRWCSKCNNLISNSHSNCKQTQAIRLTLKS